MMTAEEHREAMFGLSIAHITSKASSRMTKLTAREQHAAAIEELQRDQDESVPDEENGSSLRNNILM